MQDLSSNQRAPIVTNSGSEWSELKNNQSACEPDTQPIRHVAPAEDGRSPASTRAPVGGVELGVGRGAGGAGRPRARLDASRDQKGR